MMHWSGGKARASAHLRAREAGLALRELDGAHVLCPLVQLRLEPPRLRAPATCDPRRRERSVHSHALDAARVPSSRASCARHAEHGARARHLPLEHVVQHVHSGHALRADRLAQRRAHPCRIRHRKMHDGRPAPCVCLIYSAAAAARAARCGRDGRRRSAGGAPCIVDGMPSRERRSCSAERPSGSCARERACALSALRGGSAALWGDRARTRLAMGDCSGELCMMQTSVGGGQRGGVAE